MSEPKEPAYEILTDTPQHRPQRVWSARRADGTLPQVDVDGLLRPQPPAREE